MDFDVLPFTGVGSLRFGMSQQVVRQLIKGNVESFKRSPSSNYPCDHYSNINAFIYYKTLDHVEAIEFYSPANLIYNNVKFFEKSASQIFDLLRSFDKNIDNDDSGFTSHLLGIGIYAPEYQSNTLAPIESVIIFEKTYYK